MNKNTTFFQTAQKLWKRVANVDSQLSDQELSNQVKLQQRLLNTFYPGKYYYLVFNIFKGHIENISPEVTEVLGYEPDDLDMPLFMRNMHPEDAPYFLSFEDKIIQFFHQMDARHFRNYKIQYDLRVMNKNGEYIRLLIQYLILNFDAKNIYHSFHMHTDISHIKQEGTPCLSLIGLNGESSHYNIKDQIFSPASEMFTRREIEILKGIIEGKTSRQIANDLFISYFTVNAHRRNIMKKAGVKTPLELVRKCIHESWI